MSTRQFPYPAWEGDVNRECGRTATLLESAEYTLAELNNLEQGKSRTLVERLVADIRHTDAADVEVDCPFTGYVEAWATGRVLRWNCPVCDYEHEEQPDDD